MNSRASPMKQNHSGKTGAYMKVLNYAPLYGLSLLARRFECERVTFMPAISAATVLDVVDAPGSGKDKSAGCRRSTSSFLGQLPGLMGVGRGCRRCTGGDIDHIAIEVLAPDRAGSLAMSHV